jgi:hypothetical protein
VSLLCCRFQVYPLRVERHFDMDCDAGIGHWHDRGKDRGWTMMDAGDVVATLRTALPDLTARRDYREPLSDMVEACPVNDSFHGGDGTG